MKIEVLNHAAVKLTAEKIFYFDPYEIKNDYHDADYIFITHDHYDHYDDDSIKKVSNENTKLIVPECLKDIENSYLVVEPNKEYTLDNTYFFQTIPAYNTNKAFHPKEKNYVGYNILINGLYYYIMGDTDRTPETDNVKTDICFVPIGGTYTMDTQEASEYINYLQPKKCIPIHYGKVVGDMNMPNIFKEKINKNIEVEILINN